MIWGMLLFSSGGSPAVAQELSGLLEGYSPFIYLPGLQGEMKGRVTWVQIISGKQSIPDLGIDWDLRDTFNLTSGHWFVDYMVRAQLSRLSGRLYYEIRDFAVTSPFQNISGQADTTARFSYSGIRLGADLDIFQRKRTRLGADVDFDLYSPVLTESIVTPGGKSIDGSNAVTLGVHGIYNPVMNCWGTSPILEARARWPISQNTKVTDWEVSGGLTSPDTILGTMALKGGYRRTTVQFTASQAFQNRGVGTDFDVVMSGWFTELIYYY
jgi:hypothetical protein